MFRVPNPRHSLDEDGIVRLMGIMPRFLSGMGLLTGISVKI
jgi:hypothetical protein